MSLNRNQVINLFTAIWYISLYRFIHTEILAKCHMDFGFYNIVETNYEIILSNIIALVPILFYSSRKVASNYISIMIYFFFYVPTIVTLQYNLSDYLGVIVYQLIFSLSMILFFLSDRFNFEHIGIIGRCLNSGRNLIKIKHLIIIGLLLLTVVIWAYWGTFKLVSYNNVYDLRSKNAFILAAHPYLGYFVLWLTFVFIPLFSVLGLILKKSSLIILSFVIGILIYASSGSKTAFAAPILAIGLFYCLKFINFKYFFSTLTSFFSVFALIAFFIGSKAFFIRSFLFERVLGICGFMSYAYLEFFKSHPYTYYTHIKIIDKLSGGYPYQYVLGKEVAGYIHNIDPKFAMNANANFMITDGLAAAGKPGICIISIFFFFLLILINTLSKKIDYKIVFVLLSGSVVSLLNVSIFTTLLSGGLIFIMILFKFFPFESVNKI